MPWYTLIPPYKGNALNGHAWVPMDDHNNMAWTMTFHPVRPLTEEELELCPPGPSGTRLSWARRLSSSVT